MRQRCIDCGRNFSKSAKTDPFLCRECEQANGIELGRYAWLDH